MSQRLISAGEQSGLQTRIATTESVSLRGADEKLTAFLELEAAVRNLGRIDLTGKRVLPKNRRH